MNLHLSILGNALAMERAIKIKCKREKPEIAALLLKKSATFVT
jgi:hypothetical protein